MNKHRQARKDEIDDVLNKMNSTIEKIDALDGEMMDDIAGSVRGYEGTAGRYYFGLLSSFLVKEYQFKGRRYRPAEDPFNAFLNYGYGIFTAGSKNAS